MRIYCSLIILFFSIQAVGCGGSTRYKAHEPVPDDMMNISQPAERNINIIADAFDKQIIEQIEQSLDLSRQLRNIFGKRKEAYNTDDFDEVANSSWFVNRNFLKKMSLEEIFKGPDKGNGPDTSGVWTIFRAKSQGVTPGFHIRDSRGDKYVIKFDPPGYLEMIIGSELVSTKLFFAAGYHTPENYRVYFRPEILVLGENVNILDEKGTKRLMTDSDLEDILKKVEILPDGSILALASKYIEGKLLGPFKYKGTRKDDPNDLIPHQHRRELRGLRVIAAWLNHFDTKAGNSMDSYVTEGNRSYVRHYLMDFGSTLGSGAISPADMRTGFENYFDPHVIFLNFISLGLYVKPWEKLKENEYPAIGNYESSLFRPEKYKFINPNPAFENMTDRDGYWGAKIVMSFTDEQIKAAVSSADYSDQDAADYLSRTIIERRDIVGRYWFSKVNPLDKFKVIADSSEGSFLSFSDLAIDGGLVHSEDSYYQIVIRRPDGTRYSKIVLENDTKFKLPKFASDNLSTEDPNIFLIEIRTRRESSGLWSKRVTVFVVYREDSENYEIVANRRES
ncbi:hypothetical protein E3V55_05475 [Candidatus Marinimicrobia bacterium MT.SAG.3]|nr:hypothetical protein E3V55_05475 [Candidatus Marinimicrobia bacterium MT.SAG.3]